MKLFRSILGTGLILLASLAVQADEGAALIPILPKQFAGWQMAGAARKSQDPAAADPVNAALLKEYGFTDFASATYTRDDGSKLTVKAARFPDASGAYGAFTYYRSPVMLEEKIGDQGASLNERVLFYRGNILIDAVFQKLSAMSAAQLRELSGQLPLPAGSAQNLASFLSYFPHAGAQQTLTTKYVMGPVGLQKINAPLPAEIVDFDNGAEVGLANYSGGGGNATLMLISYPTPQIAVSHLKKIEAAQEQNSKQPGSVPALAGGPIFAKRTGPMVVVVAGPMSRSDAQAWLSSVNYEANVTWNEKNPFDKRGNIGTIVWNALLLSGIVMVLALIAGLAFGGARIVAKRLFPHNSFGRPDETEFISLQLEDGRPDASDAKVS
jgi:hypothetical protein